MRIGERYYQTSAYFAWAGVATLQTHESKSRPRMEVPMIAFWVDSKHVGAAGQVNETETGLEASSMRFAPYPVPKGAQLKDVDVYLAVLRTLVQLAAFRENVVVAETMESDDAETGISISYERNPKLINRAVQVHHLTEALYRTVVDMRTSVGWKELNISFFKVQDGDIEEYGWLKLRKRTTSDATVDIA